MVTRRGGRESPHMQYVVMIGSDGMLAYQLHPPHSGQKVPASAGETPDDGMELVRWRRRYSKILCRGMSMP